jgi:hypothetical protein
MTSGVGPENGGAAGYPPQWDVDPFSERAVLAELEAAAPAPVYPWMHPETGFDREAFLQHNFMVGSTVDGSEVASPLTDERQKIVIELSQQPWFQATSPGLQAELVTLPQSGAENHDGFLADLASRPSVVAGAEVLSMAALARGKFALIPIFNVNNRGTHYTYEYVSWRYGPTSGAKGIIFVRPFEGAEPTHFITLVGEAFATGKKTNDTVGGFADLGVGGVQKMVQRIEHEVEEEVGVSEVDEVIDLGVVNTDRGMTNNAPRLFMAWVSSETAAQISSRHVNTDIYELQSGALILPMQHLRDFVVNNTDAFFHSAMLKAMADGHIAPEWLMRERAGMPAVS